ncbi:hypothetical protein B0T19DRAFT_424199 [Cercophora scortea]|uniref:Uncharacterized protein n=1 Tax=Cercophora scortea TaxID=314031 RepID=A0AAE0INC0_9PEZI|nr:hypothetical protein B0T19DRAFT_424199 [Cercophora scortea]
MLPLTGRAIAYLSLLSPQLLPSRAFCSAHGTPLYHLTHVCPCPPPGWYSGAVPHGCSLRCRYRRDKGVYPSTIMVFGIWNKDRDFRNRSPPANQPLDLHSWEGHKQGSITVPRPAYKVVFPLLPPRARLITRLAIVGLIKLPPIWTKNKNWRYPVRSGIVCFKTAHACHGSNPR